MRKPCLLFGFKLKQNTTDLTAFCVNLTLNNSQWLRNGEMRSPSSTTALSPLSKRRCGLTCFNILNSGIEYRGAKVKSVLIAHWCPLNTATQANYSWKLVANPGWQPGFPTSSPSALALWVAALRIYVETVPVVAKCARK